MWISTSEHSKRIDERSQTEFGMSSRVLMERAGLAVFDVVKSLLPNGGRISVVCGSGKNGGDGFVVARLAHDAGFHVECLVAASPGDLVREAAEQMMAMRAQGLEPIFYEDPRWQRKIDCLGCRELTVDALLGIGGKNHVHGPVKHAIQAINRSGVPTVSIDVPSGIDCDTGDELGESVWALKTVTFGQPKPYLFQGIGLEHAGHWTISEIGYPNNLLQESTDARLVDKDWVSALLPERLRASHKHENGCVLIIAGSLWMRGAAVLAAKAALRSGAGLVKVASIPSVCDAVIQHCPEATVLPLTEIDGVICPSNSELVLRQQANFHSVVFGPGLTHEAPIYELLARLWPKWEIPSVLDADALNCLSQGVDMPQCESILTPHPGEMGRLLKRSTAEVQANRFESVQHATSLFNHAVLLKGAYSIVGEPNEPMMVNSTGNPGMASAGMGDVLSGVIATLMAQDMPSYYAGSCSTYWHGLAGDICAEEIGPTGFLARDVISALPKAKVQILGCKTV